MVAKKKAPPKKKLVNPRFHRARGYRRPLTKEEQDQESMRIKGNMRAAEFLLSIIDGKSASLATQLEAAKILIGYW
jgi:hypothetical protein